MHVALIIYFDKIDNNKVYTYNNVVLSTIGFEFFYLFCRFKLYTFCGFSLYGDWYLICFVNKINTYIEMEVKGEW